MAQHEVHSDTNWRRIDLDKSGIPVERQEFRPRLAVQPEIIAARPPCFARSPVEHGPGKSAAGEPPRDRQAMNVQRFAVTRFRPEHHILIVEIHASAEFTPCPRDHQLIRLCDTGEFFAGCLLFSPKRFATVNQPLRGFADQRVNLLKRFASRAPNLQISQAP